ncbi:hypothetical protein, partial [Clostridium thailandense]|uniref:hypothetical protein n=1 Tax=Clostridium thailandense TaxID=2794346 RepID=UPI001C48D744
QRFLAFLKIWALDLSKVFIVLEECKYIPEHKLSVGRGCLYYTNVTENNANENIFIMLCNCNNIAS